MAATTDYEQRIRDLEAVNAALVEALREAVEHHVEDVVGREPECEEPETCGFAARLNGILADLSTAAAEHDASVRQEALDNAVVVVTAIGPVTHPAEIEFKAEAIKRLNALAAKEGTP